MRSKSLKFSFSLLLLFFLQISMNVSIFFRFAICPKLIPSGMRDLWLPCCFSNLTLSDVKWKDFSSNNLMVFCGFLEFCQWCRYKLSRDSTDAKGQEDCNVWEHWSLHLFRFLSRHGYRSNENKAVSLIKIIHDYLDHWSSWVIVGVW